LMHAASLWAPTTGEKRIHDEFFKQEGEKERTVEFPLNRTKRGTAGQRTAVEGWMQDEGKAVEFGQG